MIRAVLAAFLALAASDATAQSLVGKWDCDGRNGPGRAAKAVMEFNANGRFHHYLSMGIGNKRGRAGAVVSLKGKWALSGNRLNETASTVKVTRVEFGQTDITNTPEGRFHAKRLRNLLTGPGSTSRTRVEFLKSGRINLISRTITVNCTRR